MRAGELRHVIVIQEATPTEDANGQPIDAWETYATVYGQVESTGGNEGYRGWRQIAAEVTHVVTIRSTAQTRAVTPKHRLTWDGKTLQIGRILDPEGRDRMLVLHCTERAAGATGA